MVVSQTSSVQLGSILAPESVSQGCQFGRWSFRSGETSARRCSGLVGDELSTGVRQLGDVSKMINPGQGRCEVNGKLMGERVVQGE